MNHTVRESIPVRKHGWVVQHVVLYNARGADSMAAVIRRRRLHKFPIGEIGLAK